MLSHYLCREFRAAPAYAVTMGLRIKTLRQERGLTQSELASMAGVSRSLLTMYENETRNPNTKRLASIARALGVPPEALFDSGEEVWDIALKLQLLSAENRAMLVRLAESLADRDEADGQ